jgi:hypothetical protein
MGGIKSQNCNKLAVEIWEWCTEGNIWLKCFHIPGKSNIEADKLSREFNDQVEWQLDHDIFFQVCSKLGCPDIDLHVFASRLNAQVEVFCSWKQDPECGYVDSFSLNWRTFDYVFPPFSLMDLCIKKIREDQARGIIIALLWPTQTWFTGLMKSIVKNPLLLPRRKDLLLNHHEKETHLLWEKMTLIACQVSGELTEILDFQKQLPPILWHHGELVQKTVTVSNVHQKMVSVLLRIYQSDPKLVRLLVCTTERGHAQWLFSLQRERRRICTNFFNFLPCCCFIA